MRRNWNYISNHFGPRCWHLLLEWIIFYGWIKKYMKRIIYLFYNCMVVICICWTGILPRHRIWEQLPNTLRGTDLQVSVGTLNQSFFAGKALCNAWFGFWSIMGRVTVGWSTLAKAPARCAGQWHSIHFRQHFCQCGIQNDNEKQPLESGGSSVQFTVVEPRLVIFDVGCRWAATTWKDTNEGELLVSFALLSDTLLQAKLNH